MIFQVFLDVPDDFLNSITPDAVKAFLSENGFRKYSELYSHTGKPEVWGDDTHRFLVCTDKSVYDYARSLYEVFTIVNGCREIDILSILNHFGLPGGVYENH